MIASGDGWITLQCAREIFCVPVATWRRWLREGRIGHSRLGGRVLIRRTEVEDWLARNYHPAKGAAVASHGVHVALLSDRVDPESILATLGNETTQHAPRAG